MAAWTLIPCLAELRAEFNRLSPGRDKGADGSIGDSAHTSRSDHTPDEDSSYLRDHDADSKNEVHALDTDSSGPWSGAGTQKERFHRINMRILAGEREKWKSATDRCRLNYMIWDRKIYDKDNDFEPRDYNGSDPHTSHAHYSGRYESASESDTRPWGVHVPQPIEEPEMAFKDEKIPLTGTAGAELYEPDREAGTEVEAASVLQLAAIWARRAALNTDTVEASLATIGALVQALVSREDVDEAALAEALVPALAAAVLAGLPDGTLTGDDIEQAVRNVLLTGAAPQG